MAVALRDPIHGSIPVADWAMPIIDSAVMQRLRRIQQLGTAHLVYPGANHKRFEHSLGASHLGGRLATALGMSDDDVRTVKAAALLHDVGHGPFSHAFEALVKEQGRRHEETSQDLIRWGPLADLLRQGGLDPVVVADCVAGKGALAPLVSGSLDADRMDYLLRDAHYTGVRTTVDIDRLAEVVERDARHGLVLQDSGILAAEGLLTTRFLMYPAVYLHHTVRAGESLLLAAIRCHLADGHATLADLERETDDGLLWRIRGAGGAGAELIRRLDDRKLPKRAYEGRATDDGLPVVRDMRERPAARRRIEGEIADAAGLAHHLVHIDVPRPPKFREAGLNVRLRDGSTRPLPEVSHLVQVLHEARMDHWRWWVFAPKADRDRVAAAVGKVLPELASRA
ncbi:MAG: HD domain-containing protein [Candidatus Thermoplasmatota archaeon]